MESGCLKIVMDYARGGDLSHVVSKMIVYEDHIPEVVIRTWLCQALLGLQYLHETKSILHRDIKTANLFLGGPHGDRLLIGDFGISKQLEVRTPMQHTQLGTPYFLAPEVCKGVAFSLPADVWSMGCVFFELMALRPAYSGASVREVYESILSDALPTLPHIYSEALKDLIKKMLTVDWRFRPSVSELLNMDYLHETINLVNASFEREIIEEEERKKMVASASQCNTLKKAPALPEAPLSCLSPVKSISQNAKTLVVGIHTSSSASSDSSTSSAHAAVNNARCLVSQHEMSIHLDTSNIINHNTQNGHFLDVASQRHAVLPSPRSDCGPSRLHAESPCAPLSVSSNHALPSPVPSPTSNSQLNRMKLPSMINAMPSAAIRQTSNNSVNNVSNNSTAIHGSRFIPALNLTTPRMSADSPKSSGRPRQYLHPEASSNNQLHNSSCSIGSALPLKSSSSSQTYVPKESPSDNIFHFNATATLPLHTSSTLNNNNNNSTSTNANQSNRRLASPRGLTHVPPLLADLEASSSQSPSANPPRVASPRNISPRGISTAGSARVTTSSSNTSANGHATSPGLDRLMTKLATGGRRHGDTGVRRAA